MNNNKLGIYNWR